MTIKELERELRWWISERKLLASEAGNTNRIDTCAHIIAKIQHSIDAINRCKGDK